jgi:hypothetical protein
VHGREAPLRQLDDLAARAADGAAGALVLSGTPGTGRTALLDASRRRLAATMQVLRCSGSPARRAVPFGGLARLLEPVAPRLAPLSGQRPHLLAGAIAAEPNEDLTGVALVHVGHALVQFLSLLADHRPVVVQVDDAAMLDPSSLAVLRFAADRLQHDRVALVFSTTPKRADQLAAGSLPVMDLRPLDEQAAAAVLHERHPDLAPAAAQWVLEAARGLPLSLALLPELTAAANLRDPAAVDPAENPGGENDPVARFASAISRSNIAASSPWQLLARIVAEHVAALDAGGRLAALAVATSDDGLDHRDARRVLRALDLRNADLASAIATAVLTSDEVGTRLAHPSLGSVVTAGRDAAALRSVHAALAAVEGDPTLRARLLDQAATGKDEKVAAALRQAATTAARRGASMEAAEAFERAEERSHDSESNDALLAGAADHYLTARDAAGFRRAEDRRLRHTRSDAARGRLFAERVLAEEAHDLTADADGDLEQRALLAAGAAPDAAVRLLVALAVRRLAAGSFRQAHTASTRALDYEARIPPASRGDPETDAAARQLRLELVRSTAGVALGDEPSAARLGHPWERLLSEQELVARPLPACFAAQALLWLGHQRRALSMLDRLEGLLRFTASPVRARVLCARARARIRTGDWIGARIDVAAAEDVATLARAGGVLAEAAALAGWLDAATGADGRAASSLTRAAERDPDTPSTARSVLLGRAMVALSAGAAHDALDPLERAERAEEAAGLVEPGASTTIGDLCEAAWRSRNREIGLRALPGLEARAARAGRPAALAVAARSRALLQESEFAEHFEEALSLHGDAAEPFERARTLLCFGERLVQARRRREARPPLRSALAGFEALGAVPWADKARRQLESCGEHRPASPTLALVPALTIRQLRIGRALADGLSVADVSRELLVSRRTVTHELGRARATLGLDDDAALLALVGPALDRPRAASTHSR